MITTVAELDASISEHNSRRMQSLGLHIPDQRNRRVPDGAPAPYELGDIVAVLFTPLFGRVQWVGGMIRECKRPTIFGRPARRFTCTVAIGNSVHTQFMSERVYCWEDGYGEEIVPLRRDDDDLVSVLDELNASGR